MNRNYVQRQRRLARLRRRAEVERRLALRKSISGHQSAPDRSNDTASGFAYSER